MIRLPVDQSIVLQHLLSSIADDNAADGDAAGDKGSGGAPPRTAASVRIPLQLAELRRSVGDCESASTAIFEWPAATSSQMMAAPADWRWQLRVFPNSQFGRPKDTLIVYLVLTGVGGGSLQDGNGFIDDEEQAVRRLEQQQLVVNMNLVVTGGRMEGTEQRTSVLKSFDWRKKTDRWTRHEFDLGPLLVGGGGEQEAQLVCELLDPNVYIPTAEEEEITLLAYAEATVRARSKANGKQNKIKQTATSNFDSTSQR